jgi:hypothetical protein
VIEARKRRDTEEWPDPKGESAISSKYYLVALVVSDGPMMLKCDMGYSDVCWAMY